MKCSNTLQDRQLNAGFSVCGITQLAPKNGKLNLALASITFQSVEAYKPYYAAWKTNFLQLSDFFSQRTFMFSL